MEKVSQKSVLILAGLMFLMTQSFGLPFQEIVDEKVPPPKEAEILYEVSEDADPNIASEPAYFTEFDIAHTREEYEALHNTGPQKRGVGLRNESYKWPGKTVPYTIATEFTAGEIKKIENALAEISHYSCIKFKRATKSDKYQINIVSDSGCWSYAGRVKQKQKLSFDRSLCISHGRMIHEMLHTLGFQHEHNRPDRDNYVTINLANVIDFYKNMFTKKSSTTFNTFGLPYDYLSITHYGKAFASKNRRNTITTKDSAYQDKIGQRKGMSFLDVWSLNKMYNCLPANCNKTDADCPNGFLGQDCRCWCSTTSIYHQLEYCSTADKKKYGSLKFVPS